MKEDIKTVLVIEDEDFISTIISRSLKEEGYNVIATADFKSSIIVLDTGKIDLVISDVMLPFDGGLDIVDHVRERKKTADTPIILVTGMDKDVLASSALKVNAIFPKPFDMNELIDKVDELLGKATA